MFLLQWWWMNSECLFSPLPVCLIISRSLILSSEHTYLLSVRPAMNSGCLKRQPVVRFMSSHTDRDRDSLTWGRPSARTETDTGFLGDTEIDACVSLIHVWWDITGTGDGDRGQGTGDSVLQCRSQQDFDQLRQDNKTSYLHVIVCLDVWYSTWAYHWILMSWIPTGVCPSMHWVRGGLHLACPQPVTDRAGSGRASQSQPTCKCQVSAWPLTPILCGALTAELKRKLWHLQYDILVNHHCDSNSKSQNVFNNLLNNLYKVASVSHQWSNNRLVNNLTSVSSVH